MPQVTVNKIKMSNQDLGLHSPNFLGKSSHLRTIFDNIWENTNQT